MCGALSSARGRARGEQHSLVLVRVRVDTAAASPVARRDGEEFSRALRNAPSVRFSLDSRAALLENELLVYYER